MGGFAMAELAHHSFIVSMAKSVPVCEQFISLLFVKRQCFTLVYLVTSVVCFFQTFIYDYFYHHTDPFFFSSPLQVFLASLSVTLLLQHF